MAIIPLRAYNREIEGMIDNGQLDEAVAHCRHILATFPKYIASYRLLGKAHLEQQRISDATDIFQRVLSSVPDDFIANVGMSIIREDENNLDAAIWHMELAYEAQPANLAIQDELLRLYGRRDGMQPPKVRLTRGALARMYAKGGLFDQAIAELRVAISEDPNRPDLQLLLAQMFYQTSQRVEAVETCGNIIKKIPYCLEANRILAVSLSDSKGSEAIKNYRQIVISLDPYFAFAGPDTISSDQVPENAVNIERLEWKSGIQVGETHTQPNWATSLGISIEKQAEEKLPDWLKSAEAPTPAPTPTDEKAASSVSPFIWDTQEVEKIITDTSKPEGEIPDWMKDAGWKPATGEATEAPEDTTQAPDEAKPEEPVAEVPASGDLENAEIPDWLRGIAPESVTGEETETTQPGEDSLSSPWLEQHQPGPTDSIIQWLEEKKPETPITPSVQDESLAVSGEDEMPDWLKDLELPQTPDEKTGEPAESAPVLTSPLSPLIEQPAQSEPLEAKLSTFEESLEQPGEPQPFQPETVLPDTSAAAESAAALADEIPDWLKDLAGEQTAAEVVVPAADEISTEIPVITEPEPASEPLSSSEEIQSEGLPVISEEIPPAARPTTTEELPEDEIPAIIEELPIAEVPSVPEKLPATEIPLLVEELTEVKIPKITGEQSAADEMPAPAEEEKASELSLPSEELPVTETQQVPEEQPQIEQPLPVEAELEPATSDLMSGSDAFAWSEGLAAEQGSNEQVLSVPPLEGEIPPPEWVKLEAEPVLEASIELEPKAEETTAVPAEEIPEWIRGLGETPEIEAEPEEPASAVTLGPEIPQAEELPAWLLELEKPEPEKEEPEPSEEAVEWKSEELPTWINELTETAPSDSIPAEEAPAALESPVVGEVPNVSAEPGSEWTMQISPPSEVSDNTLEEPQPETASWVPEVEESVEPVPAIAVEAEVAPASVVDELATKSVDVPAIPTGTPLGTAETLSEANQAALTSARNAISQGSPTQAAEYYTGLIKQNFHLDDIIKDLQDAVYRFPIDVDMWVTLGDAYFRTDELQEALTAYTKAEELVR